MKCPLCGFEFEEEESAPGCNGCPLAKGCKLVRCPNCSYETPAQPSIISILQKLRRKNENGTQ